jgi:hypothetical protein
VTAAIHAALYVVPGLAFLGLGEWMRRLGAVAIAASRGREPPWARRVFWLSIGLIGAAGAALLVFGGLMAAIVLRGTT